MKYNIFEKTVSTVKNLFTTNPLQYWYFFNRTKKAKQFFEDRFSWDNTKEEDYDERDYTLDGTTGLAEVNRAILYLIDQWQTWRTRNACVPISILVWLYYNCWLKPDYEEILGFLNFLEKEKVWFEAYGASAPVLIKKLIPEWNRLHPEKKVEYRRVFHNSFWYHELLDKGYLIAWGRSTFTEYSLDVLDRVINFFWYSNETRVGGHFIAIIKAKFLKGKRFIEIESNNKSKEHFYTPITWTFNEDEVETVINQYPTTKQNQINIYAHPQLSSHVKRGIWYSWFYAVLPIEPVKVVEEAEEFKLIPTIENTTIYTPILNQKIKEGHKTTFLDFSWPEQKLKELIEIWASNQNITKKK